jgi:hypothetical protein
MPAKLRDTVAHVRNRCLNVGDRYMGVYAQLGLEIEQLATTK